MACSEQTTLMITEDKNESNEVVYVGGPGFKEKGKVPPDLNTFTVVLGLSKKIFAISCGDLPAAAIDSLGGLFTWGGGKTAQ